MKISFFALFLGLIITNSYASGTCIAKMQKSTLKVFNNGVLVFSEQGYYEEFKNIYKEKGYEVCLGKECDGKKIDTQFGLSLMSVSQLGLFGASFFSTLGVVIDGNRTTISYESKNLNSALRIAKRNFSKLVRDCEN